MKVRFLKNLEPCLLGLTAVILLGCGGSQEENESGRGGMSPAQKAFALSSMEYKIPARFLVAVGFIESHLKPKKSNSIYNNKLIGPDIGQSAFGIARDELGILNGVSGDKLSVQVAAYSRWVSTKMSGGLVFNIQDDDDKFSWVWFLAGLHRQDDSTRILFAKELIEKLNSGFHWIDPDTQKVVPFQAENPPIDVSNLRSVSQKRLKLSQSPSPEDVPSAQFVVLRYQHDLKKEQVPNGIEVIHCPFSFSACIEMQTQKAELQEADPFWLGAHYIIPQDHTISKNPLQIYLHKYAVPRINSEGGLSYSKDKIVVMLTGIPGRYISGNRSPANPTWLTPWQLQRMGYLVNDICLNLEKRNSKVEFNKCKKNTIFHHVEGDQVFKWGDISDYDFRIFNEYVQHRNLASGKVMFEFPGDRKIFSKEENVSLNLSFGLQAHHIQLERLIRCPNTNRVMWTIVAKEDVRARKSLIFEKAIYDAGPNLNGTHYFRAKVYGKNGTLSELLGWDLSSVFIHDFEPGSPILTADDCFIN